VVHAVIVLALGVIVLFGVVEAIVEALLGLWLR
jgi:hypothetical protein